MTKTATGHLRGNGGVQGVAGTVAELLAQTVDGGEVMVTREQRRPCVLVGASMPIMASSLRAWTCPWQGRAEVDVVRGVYEGDQEGEREWLDTLVRAGDRCVHHGHVGVAWGDGITMPSWCRGGERGQWCRGVVQRVLGFQCKERGGQGWTWSTISASMGTILSSACKVFVDMAARRNFLNFAKIFHGCDAYILWHLPVALVCKVEVVW